MVLIMYCASAQVNHSCSTTYIRQDSVGDHLRLDLLEDFGLERYVLRVGASHRRVVQCLDAVIERHQAVFSRHALVVAEVIEDVLQTDV